MKKRETESTKKNPKNLTNKKFYKAPFVLHIETIVLADLTLRLFIPTKFGTTLLTEAARLPLRFAAVLAAAILGTS